jgi:serpin B
MNSLKALVSLSLLSIIFISCEKDIVMQENEFIERKDIVLTRSQMDFVQSNNKFALDLFKKVSEEEEGKSMVISPLSVTFALGMVNNGAAGETLREISKTLGYNEESVEDLNSFCKTMLEQITEIDPSTKLEIANMSVVDKGQLLLKEDFIQFVQKNYKAYVCYKDFLKEDVQNFINQWCEEKTHGMIKNLFNRKITTSEWMLFLNATYFKGVWTNKFKKSDSKKEKFTLEDGNKISVNMMHQQDKFNYGQIGGVCKMMTLPYGNQAFRMVLLLPEEGNTIDDLKLSLDQELWNRIINNQIGRETDVKIPSFEMESGNESIKAALKALGVDKAFIPEEGDFSRMIEYDGSLGIADVLHKARIKVDEEGSEVAAITAITYGWGAYSSVEQDLSVSEFHADRPFVYAITEVSTGAILFMGQYTGR